MQALLQEKEEKLRTLENQKADLERAAEAMAKQMRQREENEGTAGTHTCMDCLITHHVRRKTQGRDLESGTGKARAGSQCH